jgi:hypothetical protein
MADERVKHIEALEREFDRLNAELELIDPGAANRPAGTGIHAGDPADQWAEELRARRDDAAARLGELRGGDLASFERRRERAESAVADLAAGLAESRR